MCIMTSCVVCFSKFYVPDDTAHKVGWGIDTSYVKTGAIFICQLVVAPFRFQISLPSHRSNQTGFVYNNTMQWFLIMYASRLWLSTINLSHEFWVGWPIWASFCWTVLHLVVVSKQDSSVLTVSSPLQQIWYESLGWKEIVCVSPPSISDTSIYGIIIEN